MEQLKKAIDKRRNIKENSLRAYIISIKKLHNAIFGDDKEFKNIDFLKDENKVLDAIKDLKLNTQKNYLSAVIVALDAMDDKKYEDELTEYRDYLDKLNKAYQEELNENKKTEEQEENWVSMKNLKKVMNSYKSDLSDRNVFKKEKGSLTKKQMDILQMWVVANLYLHDDNPPIRLDYGNMKIISENDYNDLNDEDLETNNYLVVKSRTNKFFHFGNFKTKKSHGTKKIPVGRILNSVLNIWLKHNDTDHLLIDSRGNAMSSNQLSKYITTNWKKNNSKFIKTYLYLRETSSKRK
jgi:23S rRNA pseudoU1915 N3-methylase RlmH